MKLSTESVLGDVSAVASILAFIGIGMMPNTALFQALGLDLDARVPALAIGFCLGIVFVVVNKPFRDRLVFFFEEPRPRRPFKASVRIEPKFGYTAPLSPHPAPALNKAASVSLKPRVEGPWGNGLGYPLVSQQKIVTKVVEDHFRKPEWRGFIS